MTLSITSTTITQQDFRRISGQSSRRKPILIIGPAAAASTLAVNTAKRITTTQEAVDYCAHGPLVEAACDSLVNENRVAIIMRTAATGTAGAYVDVAGTFEDTNAPTVEGDSVVLPEDDLEPGIEFVAGGTLGTSGITYRFRTGGSLSSTLSGVQALGTATYIELPYGAGKYVFTAPEAPLVALVNELRTDLIAHFALTSGSVHGAADSTSGSGIGSAATDIATAIVLANQLRTAYEAHRVLTSGGVHGAADSTNTISAAAATTSFGAVALVNEIKADYNAHRVLTSGGVHGGSGDTTNVVSTANASPGVITAGDSITAITSAPRWSVAELGAALDAVKLLPASLDYDGILLCGPVLTKSEADSIAAKVEALRTKARWRRLAPHFRARNDGEAITAYRDAYETAFGLVAQRALHGAAVSCYMQSSHPNRFGQVDVRPFSFVYANRLATLRPDINPTTKRSPRTGLARLRGSMSAIRIHPRISCPAPSTMVTRSYLRLCARLPRERKTRYRKASCLSDKAPCLRPRAPISTLRLMREVSTKLAISRFARSKFVSAARCSRRRTARLTRTSARALNRESSKTSTGLS